MSHFYEKKNENLNKKKMLILTSFKVKIGKKLNPTRLNFFAFNEHS